MARLVRRKLPRHILPTGSGAQDPENPIDDFSIRSSGSSFAIGSDNLFWYEGLYICPLIVREFVSWCHSMKNIHDTLAKYKSFFHF